MWNCVLFNNIYRKDRDIDTSQKMSGGGALIAVNIKLSSSLLSCHYSNVEQVFVSIQRRDVRLLVGAVYLPSKRDHDLFESHSSATESLLTNSRFSDILIAGDFNIRGIKWDFSQPSADGINSPNGSLLIDTYASLGLFQRNYVQNDNGNYLDLVLSSSDKLMSLKLRIDRYLKNLVGIIQLSYFQLNCSVILVL